MIASYSASAGLIASGDGGDQHASALFVLILLGAIVIVVLALLSPFRQPFVVVLDHPFRFFGKVVKVGVLSTVVAVAVISIILNSVGSPS